MANKATNKRMISGVITPSDEGNNADDYGEQNFCGFAVEEDIAASTVVALSSRPCCDRDRWETMPSLACFPALQRIDLHQCRYIVGLHESLTRLNQLRALYLIGCSRLKSIPDTIGQLEQLEEVSQENLNLFAIISCLC